MTQPTPATIAAKLSEAQKRVICAFPPGRRFDQYEYGWSREWMEIAHLAGVAHRSIQVCMDQRLVEHSDDHWVMRRLTPLGLAVRAALMGGA